MKISFVEVAGFRGFRNKVRFDLPAGFAVVTGRNGVGKSTVLDAVDFILTGTINKYLTAGSKGTGLENHIWWNGSEPARERYAAMGLVDDRGRELTVRRSAARGLETEEKKIVSALSRAISPPANFLDTLVRTTLIRDETIASSSVDLTGQSRFGGLKDALGEVSTSGLMMRLEELKRAAMSERDLQTKRVQVVKTQLATLNQSLATARSQAKRNGDVVEAEAVIAELVPSAPVDGRDLGELLRREVAARRQRIAALGRLDQALKDLRSKQSELDERAAPSSMVLLETQVGEALRARDTTATALEVARQRLSWVKAADALVAHRAALLEHGKALGLELGHCPLCGAERTEREFDAALADKEGQLREGGSQLAGVAAEVRASEAALDQASRTHAGLLAKMRELSDQTVRLTQESLALESEGRRLGVTLQVSDPTTLESQLAKQADDVARLEHAVLLLDASRAHDRVVELEGNVKKLLSEADREAAELAARTEVVDSVERVGKSVKEVTNQVLEERFDTVLPVLQELYQRLRPHAEWRELAIDFGGKVRASLNLAVGDGWNPQFFFSSGQRRAMGLAFLLALHLSRPWCRLRSLLLDDPVQHIDDYRSLNLVEVLSAIRQSGRQVIIAVEDAALADLLCRRLGGGSEAGRRFEIKTGSDGSGALHDVRDVTPLPVEALLDVSA